jgi:hypothetical protein
MQTEILALWHQLTVLQRTQKRRRLVLSRIDRGLWVWLSRLWSDWRSALIMVKPETVLGWHRQGFDGIGPGRFVMGDLDIRVFRRRLAI